MSKARPAVRPAVTDVYELISDRPLGSGNYGQVFLMRNRNTGVEVAAKCLQKHTSWTPEKFRQRVAEEVRALKETKHKNVIELIDHLPDAVTEDQYWVVMKYARGGQLLHRLISRHKNKRPYTEVEVSKIVYDILSGLKHLHDRHMVHCDIKPENILFETDDEEESNLVLVDMGFATVCEPGTTLGQIRGTLEYMAPEILNTNERLRAYDAKADVWSVGCVLYMLLSGELPFRRAWGNISHDEFNKRVKYLITQGAISTETGALAAVSAPARMLISRMLTRDAKLRPSVEACLASEWFQGAAPSTLLHHDVLEELSKFNSLRGNQSYTSHSLSGIVTSLGSGSAIASISGCHAAASPSSVNILEREGGIQPLITEAYSDDDKRRSHAIEALANLAGKKDRQDDLLSAGVMRLLCHVATCALGTDAMLTSSIRFNTARAINNLTDNHELRQQVVASHNLEGLLLSLARLGWEAIAKGMWRVVIQAGCALGRLAKDPVLRKSLVRVTSFELVSAESSGGLGEGGQGALVRAVPIWFVMMLASPSGSTSIRCQDQFRCEARSVLLSMLAAAAQESPEAIKELASNFRNGVRSCQTWANLHDIEHRRLMQASQATAARPSPAPAFSSAAGVSNVFPISSASTPSLDASKCHEQHAHVYRVIATGCIATLQDLVLETTLRTALDAAQIDVLVPQDEDQDENDEDGKQWEQDQDMSCDRMISFD